MQHGEEIVDRIGGVGVGEGGGEMIEDGFEVLDRFAGGAGAAVALDLGEGFQGEGDQCGGEGGGGGGPGAEDFLAERAPGQGVFGFEKLEVPEAKGIGVGLGDVEAVGLEDQIGQAFAAAAAVGIGEGAGVGVGGDGLSDHLAEGGLGEGDGEGFVEDVDGGIEVELSEVGADEVEAEGVEGGDMGGVEEEPLTGESGMVGMFGGSGAEGFTEPLFHFSGGGMGERDDQEAIDVDAVLEDEAEAATDQGGGFAGTGAGGEEDGAAGVNGLLLLWGGSGHGQRQGRRQGNGSRRGGVRSGRPGGRGNGRRRFFVDRSGGVARRCGRPGCGWRVGGGGWW